MDLTALCPGKWKRKTGTQNQKYVRLLSEKYRATATGSNSVHCFSEKRHPPIIFCITQSKNEPILIMFGTQNCKDLSTTSEKCLVKCRTFSLIEVTWFPAKIRQLQSRWLLVYYVAINLNFRQPASKKLWKVTIVCVDTPFLSFWYWSFTMLC